jgi:hypothetical protein
MTIHSKRHFISYQLNLIEIGRRKPWQEIKRSICKKCTYSGMRYLSWDSGAWQDFQYLQKTDKKILKRLNLLIRATLRI